MIIPDGFEVYFKVGESYVKILVPRLVGREKFESSSHDYSVNTEADYREELMDSSGAVEKILDKKNALVESTNASQFLRHFGSNTCQNGAVEANTGEPLALIKYPHDIIVFCQNPVKSNFDEFRQLYLKGLSLNEVSEHTGFPVSTIRSELIANKVPLRANNKASAQDSKKPSRAFWGAIPYGYNILDGKLVIDPKEIKIVRKIMAFHQKGISFNTIAKTLTEQKIPSKTGRRWNDKTVARIIRRTKPE